ncbi:hypothetical protein MMA231_00301 [Asticcacaulis sp. MM231]
MTTSGMKKTMPAPPKRIAVKFAFTAFYRRINLLYSSNLSDSFG